MKYILTKSKEKFKFKKKPKFIDGYSITKKMTITIYNSTLKSSIFKKKTDKKMNNLFNLFMFLENNEDDDEGGHLLAAGIEEMQILLAENPNMFTNSELNSYYDKLETMETRAITEKISQGKGRWQKET